MKSRTGTQYFYLSIAPTISLSLAERENFSQILLRLAERFDFAGMQDWQVDLGAGSRELGVEAEFRDLRSKVKESEPILLYFHSRIGAKNFSLLIQKIIEEIKVAAVKPLANKDWQKEWRKHFKPQKISYKNANNKEESFWIYPAWIKVPKGRLALRIYPGQAFGTGTHGTTQGCMELFLEIAEKFPTEMKILDFGAGTGILALSALQWARAKKRDWLALAVEIDPVAKAQIEKNAKANRLKLSSGLKMKPKQKYDLIFANVLQPVLLANGLALACAARPGAKIIFSGILAKEQAEFCEKMQPALALPGEKNNWRVEKTTIKGDWAAFIFGRA